MVPLGGSGLLQVKFDEKTSDRQLRNHPGSPEDSARLTSVEHDIWGGLSLLLVNHLWCGELAGSAPAQGAWGMEMPGVSEQP